jgi:hypothetical protein
MCMKGIDFASFYDFVIRFLELFRQCGIICYFSYFAPKDFKIIWLSNILTLNVPDECYSSNMSCTLTLISYIFITIKLTNVFIFLTDPWCNASNAV